MISQKCHYALRAVLELTLRSGRGPVTIHDIASAQGIPARFLEAILRELRQAGVCDSMRGKEGGYTLARDAKDITINEVIRLFEGPLVAAPTPTGPGPEAGEIFRPIWTEAEQNLDQVFSRYTFALLAEREQQRSFEKASNYTI